ncbi:class II glutamine amidotransferase [Bacillus benzoevorans]|uniref:Putative glutamine amidotransferase n=1 Tax=Bacillus benzoevorans TaxID=1456 RepID=A0A7X0LXJ7_9BACI|nr:class II glutamine amidotransferase [Bacillus benzoevorans]MBB6446577.1 putative glutamine amidotransferase [Bacillus benzoevorans]
MCELLTVKGDENIPIEWIFHYAKLLEEYGFAGFGWGVAWKNENGEIKRYRAVEGIKNDNLAPQTLRGIQSKEYLVHLRKPSLMKSIAYYNSQPYLNYETSFAFAHNGYFIHHEQHRAYFAEQLEGTSDSEVGYQYYLKKLKDQFGPQVSLELTHQELGGKANLMVLRKEAGSLLYAGNDDNRMYMFNLEGIQCAATSLHSQDDFIFQTIFPTASNIQQIPLFTSCELTAAQKAPFSFKECSMEQK